MRQAATASVSTKACGEEDDNKYWAHTFADLCVPCCHIEEAYLKITVTNNHYNDRPKTGCITNYNDTWEVSKTLTDSGIPVGSIGTLILELETVNCPIGLDTIEGNGFLDIAVEDNSPVDCAVLHVTYGP